MGPPVHLEDLKAPFVVGEADLNMHLEAAGPQQRLVQHVLRPAAAPPWPQMVAARCAMHACSKPAPRLSYQPLC